MKREGVEPFGVAESRGVLEDPGGKASGEGRLKMSEKRWFGWSFTGRRWGRNPLGQKEKGEEGTCPRPPAIRIDWNDGRV